MIPVRLEMHNFLAYRDPAPLSLDGIHVACISGENGSGKSSLLDAMTWALWGRARSASADDLIYQNQKDARVTLDFQMGDMLYRVMRQRNIEKKTALSLVELQVFDPDLGDWRALSEHSMRGTQDRLNSILRLDYDTFVNSAMLAQGHADEFTAKPPGQRIQVLAAILGLERWTKYEEDAKERIRAARENMQRVEGRLQEIERELARRAEYVAGIETATRESEAEGTRLAESEAAWSEGEKQRAARADADRQVADMAQRLTAAQRELAEATSEHEALTRRANFADSAAREAALQVERERAVSAQASWHETQEKIQEQSGLIGQIKGETEALAPQTEPLKKRMEMLETSTEPECPTCGQPLTEAHKKKVIAELSAEIESRRENYRINTSRMKSLAAELDCLRKEAAEWQSAVRSLPEIERHLAELTATRKAAQESEVKLPAAKERVARWEKIIAEDSTALANLKENQIKLGACDTNFDALRATLEKARLAKRMADERVGGARQKLAALQELDRQQKELHSSADESRRALSLLEELRDAFGRRGVPTMIIETAVPEMEREANRLLADMSDGRMRLRMETQKETKAGDARDTLELFISDDLGTRAYEMYSGGEAFRINFAIRIALSRLLARRAGAQLRALFIDEGFGTQDAAGRERLVAAIQSVQNDFDRILVITHLDELRDAFPARIEVTKTASGSQVRVA
jgi:DNA repair protein SbcC/Rad50